MIFQDNKISFKAKGIFYTIQNSTDKTSNMLLKASSDGRAAVYSGLKELKDKGYIQQKVMRGDGKISGVQYKIIQDPEDKEPFTPDIWNDKGELISDNIQDADNQEVDITPDNIQDADNQEVDITPDNIQDADNQEVDKELERDQAVLSVYQNQELKNDKARARDLNDQKCGFHHLL